MISNILSGSKILLLICLLACTPTTVESQKKDKVIIKMECVAVDWGASFYSRQTPQNILARTGNYSFDRVIVQNDVYLRDLQQQIEQLRPATDVVSMDVRTVCLLQTDKKKVVDTLSLSDFRHCQYNGKFYHLTWTLLQTIMKKMPHEQIATIEWWLQDDPTLKEKLIANEIANEKK